jgi:hypothetical protein
LEIDTLRPRGLAARRESEFIEKSEEITEKFLSRDILQRHPRKSRTFHVSGGDTRNDLQPLDEASPFD